MPSASDATAGRDGRCGAPGSPWPAGSSARWSPLRPPSFCWRGSRAGPASYMYSTSPPDPITDLTDTVVAGKYRVEEFLGRGAMGSVWAARHTSLGHNVAIKFISPELANNRDAVRRFETE